MFDVDKNPHPTHSSKRTQKTNKLVKYTEYQMRKDDLEEKLSK